MKQKFGKLRVILIVALLISGMFATTAFASNPALPPSEGTLTIHKFLMDDTSGASLPNDGNEAGAGTNPSVPSDAVPLDGITFNLYKITPNPTTGALPSVGPYRLLGTTMTDGTGATFAVTAAIPPSLTTAGGGLATATLSQGYYLVIEQTSALVAGPADPFVVPVPMTEPDGEGWITDVHVYPKNEGMSVEKTVIDPGTAINIGDRLTYEIIPSIPSGIYSDIPAEDAIIKYSIIDTLDTALTLDASSIRVCGRTTKTGTDTLIPATNYTVSGNFRVEFNAAGRKHMFDNGYKFLSITFDAIVNEGVLSKPGYTVENQPEIDFTNKFDEEKHGDGIPEKIHTAAVEIIKEDAATAEKLAGAEFQIASSLSNAQNGIYLKKLPATHATRPNAIVDADDPDYADAQPWIATTASGTGIAKFEGLKDYSSTFDTDGTEIKTYLSYYIVETKAPSGYNLLDAPIKVTFSEENSTETNSYTISVTVKNTNKFTLPQTGGMGTVLFTVGGIALVGVAIILIATSRKKN